MAAGVGWLLLSATTAAWTIDTEELLKPWPRQTVRELEVGRTPVRWRQRVSRADGLWTSLRFEAPLPLQTTWELSNQYEDVSRITPGVTALRYLEKSERREVIQIDVKALWKSVTLTFEIEQEPPRDVRFRWRDQRFGEIIGACTFTASPDAQRTMVEMATRFRARRPVPLGLLAAFERITMLKAVKSFLRTCDQRRTTAAASR